MNRPMADTRVAFAEREDGGVLATVADHVRRHPTNVAIVGPDNTLDYGTLAVLVEECAQRLKGSDIRPGELVALSGATSAMGICGLLGVLHAGATVLPLDIAQPRLRREQIIDAAGVRLSLSTTAEPEMFTVTENDRTPRTIEIAHDPAYVIYTSGSTGAPKGVVCTHTGLANVARAQRTVFDISVDDRVAQIAPWSVDAFLFETFLALTAGASLCIATPPDRYPGPPLETFLASKRTTVAVATPSSLRAVEPSRVPDLRLVVSAGEVLLPDLARAWVAGRRLVNAYGVTEATIWTSYAEITDATLAQSDVVPLGTPLPGCSITVTTDDNLPATPGAPGQICIGGLGVAAGYLDAEGTTGESFVDTPGGRLFRTGDLAVSDGNGSLTFAGRDDEQLKLGGLRVELGEIRHMLIQHQAVHDCAIRHHGHRLVAYVVPEDGAEFDHYAVIEWLEERLPIQMVPTLYVPMTALPLTAWGKVDVTALPDPDAVVAAVQQTRQRPPSGSIQEYLSRTVSQLLGVPALAADDDLFLLGLTSLTMARLLRRIDEDLSIEIEPVDVFENPTLVDLAAQIQRMAEVRR